MSKPRRCRRKPSFGTRTPGSTVPAALRFKRSAPAVDPGNAMIRPPSGHPLNTTLPRKMRYSLIVGGMLLTAWQVAPAEGVSAYLPLNLEPEMERQIERVLILADEPILKRTFAVALVEDALPQACLVDKPLCMKVKRYLQRYSRDYAVTHASATGALTHDAAGVVVPNEHGLPASS